MTGKRCDAKVSRTVWRGAHGKGLNLSTSPGAYPTFPGPIALRETTLVPYPLLSARNWRGFLPLGSADLPKATVQNTAHSAISA